MKNLKTLSLVILSLFIISCGDDDVADAGALNTTNLAGTYTLTAASGNGSSSETENGMTTMRTSTFLGSNFNNCILTFTQAGALSSSGEYTLTEMSTENGMTDTESFVTDLTDFGNIYSLSGSNLIFPALNDDDVTSSYIIRNFTSTGFELSFTVSENDTDETSETEGTFTFVKQ